MLETGQDMNIKLLLLSICLTLKVTNIQGQLELALGAIDVALQLTGMILDEMDHQEVIGMLDNIIKDVEDMYKGLSNQVYTCKFSIQIY